MSDEDDCDTLSYQCKHGDHEHCGYMWIGAPATPRGTMQRITAVRMICRCGCGHTAQREAEKFVRFGAVNLL